MAQFNPPIQPTNDPNYENRSRPIDIPDTIKPRGVEENRILPKGQEIGDKSAEYLGKAAAYGMEANAVETKGYGDLFAGIVGIGDFMAKAGVQMVKKDIEDKVYEVANNERVRYTAELEKIKATGGVKSLLDAHAEMEPETPAEIEDLPNTLDTLRGASEAGKLTKTDYNGRLLAAAKDLRSRYPGFKNEIDQEFSKVTGVNPANAYITGLVNDINRANASQNSEKNRILTYIRGKVGFDGSEEAYHKVETGEWGGNDVVKWAAPQERFRLNLSDRAAVFNDKKLSHEDQQRAGKELFDTAMTGVVQTRVDNFMRRMGLNSLADAETLDARNKAGGITAQQWSDTGQQWADEQLKLKQAILRDAREKGLVRVLGQDEVNKRTDAAMEQMKIIGDRIYSKDSGGIYKAAQWVKALGDEDQKAMLQDSIVGADARSLETIKRIGGEQYLQSLSLKNIANGLSGRFGNYQERMHRAIQAQTDMVTNGVPITLNRAFDEFKVKMKDATDSEKRQMNASMIDRIAEIGDPKVPDAIKINYAQTAFHPDNRGFISRLNVDGKDERGNVIQGQNAVFQRMTAPEITKEMYRLGQKNPEIWKNYVDWTKETLGNELINREIKDLSQIRNPAIHVGWDGDNKRLEVAYTGVVTATSPRPGLTQTGVTTSNRGATDTEYGIVQRSVARINSNLANFKNVAQASGGDVDAFMLGTIVQAAGAESLAKVDNIPADIMRQIGLTKLKGRNANSN